MLYDLTKYFWLPIGLGLCGWGIIYLIGGMIRKEKRPVIIGVVLIIAGIAAFLMIYSNTAQDSIPTLF